MWRHLVFIKNFVRFCTFVLQNCAASYTVELFHLPTLTALSSLFVWFDIMVRLFMYKAQNEIPFIFFPENLERKQQQERTNTNNTSDASNTRVTGNSENIMN